MANDESDGVTARIGNRLGGGSPQQPSLLEQFLGLQGFGLLPPALLLTLWVVVGTVGYMVIEGWTLLDAVYQTVITLSTVGLMEAHPMTPSGRLFTVVLIVAGLGTALYAFTSIGQKIVEGEVAALVGRRRMERDLRRLEDHFVVCGFGRTSEAVAEGLESEDEDFCVIDADSEIEPELQERGYVYLIGDATEEDVLEMAGVERARGLLALLPSDADNLYLTMAAKNINPEVQVVARATDDRAERNLRRGGADVIVSPYETTGNRVIQAALNPAVLEFMELATPRVQLQLSLEAVAVAEDSALDGVTLRGSEIRRRCGVIVVAIKREDDEMVFNPEPTESIRAHDTLVALGEGEDLETLERLAGVHR